MCCFRFTARQMFYFHSGQRYGCVTILQFLRIASTFIKATKSYTWTLGTHTYDFDICIAYYASRTVLWNCTHLNINYFHTWKCTHVCTFSLTHQWIHWEFTEAAHNWAERYPKLTFGLWHCSQDGQQLRSQASSNWQQHSLEELLCCPVQYCTAPRLYSATSARARD